MERPTKEVTLPVSGIIATIYTYYLRGERKEIESIMMASAEFEQVDGRPLLKKVDATYRTKMEDKAVLLAVKKFTDKEGKEVPKTVETLDSMPDSDFETLQDAINEDKVKKK